MTTSATSSGPTLVLPNLWGLRERSPMNLTDEILFDTDDGIAVITIDRPATRHAINSGATERLRPAFERLDNDVSLRLAILTGRGDKPFCAGMNLKEAAADKLRVPPRGKFPV